VQDAALADLVAGRIEKFHAVLAREEAAFVEIEKGRQRERVKNEEAADRER
jgi:hypothetical protein